MSSTTALLLVVIGLQAGLIAGLLALVYRFARLAGGLIGADAVPQDRSLSSRILRWLVRARGTQMPEPVTFVSPYELFDP